MMIYPRLIAQVEDLDSEGRGGGEQARPVIIHHPPAFRTNPIEKTPVHDGKRTEEGHRGRLIQLEEEAYSYSSPSIWGSVIAYVAVLLPSLPPVVLESISPLANRATCKNSWLLRVLADISMAFTYAHIIKSIPHIKIGPTPISSMRPYTNFP